MPVRPTGDVPMTVHPAGGVPGPRTCSGTSRGRRAVDAVWGGELRDAFQAEFQGELHGGVPEVVTTVRQPKKIPTLGSWGALHMFINALAGFFVQVRPRRYLRSRLGRGGERKSRPASLFVRYFVHVDRGTPRGG